MPYADFAWWYDRLNLSADYAAYAGEIITRLKKHGVEQGILADLACGTGEMTLRLAEAGYDMIAVDASPEMLSVLRDKLEGAGEREVLLLCQPLEELDLYGTIRGAVSTFDSLSHLPPAQLERALARVSLFMEPGGLLLFDANTLYKHSAVLADNCFELDGAQQVRCIWRNAYKPEDGSVNIELTILHDQQVVAEECFTEYAYPPDHWREMLARTGFDVVEILDGETFEPLCDQSERLLITALKR